MEAPPPDIGRARHQRIHSHHLTSFRQVPVALEFFADTNHTGSVDESDEEWRLRQRKPGAILVFNCDRDGAAAPHLDFDDDAISHADELTDFARLVIKQNANLPADCEAFVRLSSADARKVRGFDAFAVGARAALGKVGSAVRTDAALTDIRTRDYHFAFEAVQPVRNSGDELLEVHVVINRSGREVFNDFVYFTIAPWLMLSNVEELEKAYVVRVPGASVISNPQFIGALRSVLGGRLQVIQHGQPLNRWMQDVMEIGFSSTPDTASGPMHQFINSRNAGSDWGADRLRLYQRIRRVLIGSNFGHLRFPTAGARSLDSFGNLEVTPPLEDYPFGRIFYGIRDTAYSSMHSGDEMSSVVVRFLQANRFQPPVPIPTSWLAVGHVDEFLSFVPNLRAAAPEKPYKLLIASPRVAIALCRQLQADGRGSAVISSRRYGVDGSGNVDRSNPYAVSVDRFLRAGSRRLNRNQEIQRLLDRIVVDILKPEFGLEDDDVVPIPILFNGVLGSPGRVHQAIARTAGMVNCLVAQPDVIVPKPYGPPDAAGNDVFEEDARRKLEALGLTVHFVNDWYTYHVLMGEIHCGTNAKRRVPNGWAWWDRSTEIGGSTVHA